MIERCVYLRGVERVGKFWHNLILTFRGRTDLKGAIVSYHPEDPITFFNHAADINVSEDEADNLLNRVTKCFSSGGFPYACFQISRLTRPRSFASLLEDHGLRAHQFLN